MPGTEVGYKVLCQVVYNGKIFPAGLVHHGSAWSEQDDHSIPFLQLWVC